MPRPYPDRRRRRPGRRPPKRYRGGPAPRPPQGFTGPATRAAYAMFLPLRGRQRRSYFNRAAAILALAVGYSGAVQGYAWFGAPGAVLGLGCGLAAGCSFLVRGRFFRG